MDDPVFCHRLLFLCFFCSTLICEPLIDGQKGLDFCGYQNRSYTLFKNNIINTPLHLDIESKLS
jgi:hypothetical protein